MRSFPSLWSSLLFLSGYMLSSCTTPASKKNLRYDYHPKPVNIRYAKGFSFYNGNSKGIRMKNQRTYALNGKKAFARLPIQSCVITSTPILGFLKALNLQHKIIGATDIDQYYDLIFNVDYRRGKITEVGKNDILDVEKIISLNPDAVLSYNNLNYLKAHEQLERMGIPVILIDEYLEESPLGKAEWIKLIGTLFDRQAKAEEIFALIEKNYLETRNLAQAQRNLPTIFTGLMYGDLWYMPGGKSFMAAYLKDAGGKYIYENTSSTGTLPLSLEKVYKECHMADTWLNISDIEQRSVLASKNGNYALFKAFRSGKTYSPLQRKNAHGANDYFEEGTVRCDKILKDLVKILHPKLLPEHKPYFYKKLE